MKETFVRFTLRQRLEHLSVMVLFIVLAVTGFPQKFAGAAWAQLIMRLLGGVEVARFVHRLAGILFAVLTAVHLGTAIALVVSGRSRPSMVPGRKDFADAIKTGRKPLVGGEEGYQALELVDAVYRSCRTGEKVVLAQ